VFENIIPDFPSQNDNDQNGFVRQEHYWSKTDNNMRLIREITRDYHSRVVQQVKGLRIYRVSSGGGNWKEYFTKSKWRYYTEERVQEHDYDEAGNQHTLSHTQKTYHEQEKHFLPTRTEQETSDGKTLITYTKYPADYSDSEAGAVVNAMKGNKHIHNAPIQQTTTRKEGTSEVVLSSQVYLYGFGPANTFIKPLRVYQFRIPKPLKYTDPLDFPGYLPATWDYNDQSKLEPKMSYRYDERGNMIGYQREGDLPVTVLWSYAANYPVAQIRNASYDGVEAALGGKAAVDAIAVSTSLSPAQVQTLNGLRATLPNAQVSTYTFDPLTGMTSATDPAETTTKYEYDPMGRLKCVRDHHNNILQHYLYHYKVQP
jgi:YD repeat-containing protein